MPKLHIDSTEEAGVFTLSGIISADTDFSSLLQESHSHLIFRFNEINEITSVGIKKWMEGVNALYRSGKTIEYQNCPEIFIEQCNLVIEMTQNITIHSFEITFVCEDCDEEEIKMLTTVELDLKNLPPHVICPSCNEEMITEDSCAFNFITNC